MTGNRRFGLVEYTILITVPISTAVITIIINPFSFEGIQRVIFGIAAMCSIFFILLGIFYFGGR